MSFQIKTNIVFIFLLLGLTSELSAQTYGFEWIKPNQSYWKFPVAARGVCRIDSSTLVKAGLNLSLLNPKKLQLMREGKEVAIYVEGESDGVFNASDFIEFYGLPADGSLDQALYRTPEEQPQTYRSLLSDTAWYFLTTVSDTSPTPQHMQVLADTAFNSYAAESQYISTQWIAPAEDYYMGSSLNTTPRYFLSDYGDGEGWIAFLLGLGETRTYNFSTPDAIASGTTSLKINLTGASDFFLSDPTAPNHHLRIYVGPSGNVSTLLIDTTFRGYGQQSFIRTVSNTLLGAQTGIRLEVVNDLAVGSDYIGLFSIELNYAKAFGADTSLLVMHLANSSLLPRRKLVFPSYPYFKPVLYDLNRKQRIRAELKNGQVRALVQGNTNSGDYLLFDEARCRAINTLQPVNFVLVDPSQSAEFLIITHRSLTQSAQQYQSYRNQRFKTLLKYTDELYDLYTYGYKHPLAIKKFAKHLFDKQPKAPDFMLLLGRGYQNNYTRNDVNLYASNLVPAIGVPSSEHLFTEGFVASNGAPSIATSRLPAATNQEVLNYLQKLITYETGSDSIAQWRKQYLHLSGGDDYLSEQLPFAAQMNAMKSVIVQKPQGAYVYSYQKNSNKPVDQDLNKQLIQYQNNGLNMLSFLGHGSLTVLDIDFGSIGDLQPNNKPTFYYFNGCNIGNANDLDPNGSGLVYGKDYICAANKGAIGWLAHSNTTIPGYLYAQMNGLYQQFHGSNYGKGIGQQVKYMLEASANIGDEFSRSHALQLILQGDPAVSLYAPGLPDYALGKNALFVTPANVSAQDDSLAIGIIISNPGKALDDSLEIKCSRTLPDQTLVNYASLKVKTPYYQDTVYYWIKPLAKTDVGLNKFEIEINPSRTITESSYDNNKASLDFYLPGSGLIPLMPMNYALVDHDTVELIVQNNDLFAKNLTYLFEIDSSQAFSSQSPYYKASGPVAGNDLVRYSFPLAANDSQVYYWRAKINLPDNQGGLWYTQSFTHIRKNGEGWRQSQYAQVKDATAARFITFNDSLKLVEFSNNDLVLGIEDRRWDHRRMGVVIPYLLNAGVGSCMSQGTVVLVFQPFQVDFPYELPNLPFNCAFVQANKTDRSIRYYAFNTSDPSGEDGLKQLIDSVPKDYVVAMFSRYNTGIQNWKASTKSIFGALGSTKVEHVRSENTAWAVIGEKGAALGTAAEDTVNNDALAGLVDLPPSTNQPQDNAYIRIRKNINVKWYEGDFTSNKIGPALAYQSLLLNLSNLSQPATGRWWVDVIGVDRSNKDSVLITGITQPFTDLSGVSAAKFPNLKLKAHFVDSTNRTPAHIDSWQVNYAEAPELAIDPSLGYVQQPDPVNQGDSVHLVIPLLNLGKHTFDSALFSLKVMDDERNTRYIRNEKQAPIGSGKTLKIDWKLPTRNLYGTQVLDVRANADQALPEVTYNNNVLTRLMQVKGDQSNPFLDVTFDGQRIMNGDIVSPNPVIRISSTDDNHYLLQKDTSTFLLYVRRPSAFDFERIYLNQAEVQFMPATDQNNKAWLQYHPQGLADGLYTIKVQSVDASGNKAGSQEYQVDFNVINKSTITHFYPYPNPFTTSMRFVFTLTGSKAPEDLLIRILTIDGKIVREVTKEQFGNIRIGNNVSEFAWDGTDQYGQRLANGVYLYQVFTRIAGQDIENRATKAKNESKFFTGNTGKIYLMR